MSEFDKVIDRHGTDAAKIEYLKEFFGRDDLLPMWVADMDFESPYCITKALQERLNHKIYGYAHAPNSYWDSIINWEKNQNDWLFSRDEVRFVPGIVKGIAYAMHCFTQPGDSILVQPPVYMPFMNVPNRNGRKVIYNQLIYKDGNYLIDFEDLEDKCRVERPKMMILSNPHNPAGIVWGRDNLAKVASICHKYNVLVISDEIHSDMPLFGSKHITFSNASKEAKSISITFAAPSKTFNIAGIVSSFCVVYNDEIKSKYFGYLDSNEFDQSMFFSFIATEAAYTYGNPWRLEMLKYVEDNISFVEQYLKDNIPGIKMVKPQASFLIWLDCSGLGLSQDALVDIFVNKAHLALNNGEDFGPGGTGFMRFNVGTARANVEKALIQLKNSL